MSLEAIKLSDEALEFNDAPAQVWMRVRDAEKLIYSRNPKRHDFGALITSLARYGYQEAAKYDSTLRAIKAGNGRIEALAKMERDGKYPLPRGLAKHRESGEWCLPILMGTDAPSETEALAYLVDANNITMLGGDLGMHEMARMWDQDIYAGILADLQELDSAPVSMGSDDISALLAGMDAQSGGEAENVDADELVDRAEELNKKWKVKTGDLWELGEHRIVCGDCTNIENIEKIMVGDKADCTFTSPPYAVGVDYGSSYKDTIDNLRVLLPKVSETCKNIICDGGFLVFNFNDIASAKKILGQDYPCEYPMAMEYFPIFYSDGWLLWSRRVWCKPTARVNSMWCINSNRSAADWEHIWTWKKSGDDFIKQIGGAYASQRGWIDTSKDHGVDIGKEIHGAGMALSIAVYMIAVHSRSGKIVYEPFLGSGTTLIACEQLKRRCRAIEINPAYVAVALERYFNLTKIEPQRIS